MVVRSQRSRGLHNLPVVSKEKNNVGMAEWSIAGDCKSPLKGAVVRIHLPTPNYDGHGRNRVRFPNVLWLG